MWLRYGLEQNHQLVAIEDVSSGKTNLVCPYCGNELVAKKGLVKEHHFAHASDTCYMVIKREPRELPTLPLYDSFDVFLSGKELENLNKLWHRHKAHNNGIDRLEVLPAFTREKLLQPTRHLDLGERYGVYQFTALGKIPVKALALTHFNVVQEPLIEQKLASFEAAIFDNKGVVVAQPNLSFCLTDLRIYLTQLRKILRSTLYYLEVQADGQVLHKIGITSRPMTKRLTEIRQDLRAHFQNTTINVLGTWSSRGNVEKYFKYKYSDFNYPIGSLTEYFKFDRLEDAFAVKSDLERMKPKVLSQIEQGIVENEASPIEELLSHPFRQPARSLTTPVPADARGIEYLTQTKLMRVFLSRPSSQQALEALKQGCSLPEAALRASVPVDVARKVLAVMHHSNELVERE